MSEDLKKQLVIVTGNVNKAIEFSKLLGSDFEVTNKKVDLDELQGPGQKVAAHKAESAAKMFNSPVLVEDTSLYLREYGSYLGPYCKWFGVDDFGKESAERQCRNFNKMAVGCTDKTLVAECIIAYCEPDSDPVLFVGIFEGFCMDFEKGKPSNETLFFGWDPIMGDPTTGKSFAQMTMDEKNAISHKSKAVKSFVEWMKNKK
jgi:inosine triphosphate pyrophosphatase